MSRARSLARKKAVQALYSWDLSQENLNDIEQQFLLEQNMKDVDLDYFKELLHEVPGHLEEIDQHIAPKLDRPFKEVDPVECAVMRLAAYELLYRLDVPYRVVINEAIELAKTFGAEDGFKYVNSIVDSLARDLRTVEVNAKRRPPSRPKPKKS